jgi:hypothetical protein
LPTKYAHELTREDRFADQEWLSDHPSERKRPLIYRLLDARGESIASGDATVTALLEAAISHWARVRSERYKTLDEGIWAEDFASWKKEMFPWL